MKMPTPLPSLRDMDSPEQVRKILNLVSSGVGNIPNDRYVHWSKLKYMRPPEEISNEDWWLAIKFARASIRHELPLVDKNGRQFSFSDSGYLNRMLHQIDRDASGRIELPADVVNPQSRNRYLVSSLIEEAITSSQLEGAATTRRVAKEMLRTGRNPQTRGERMIVNNYRAMDFLRELGEENLSVPLLLRLQSILTEATVEDEGIVGRFRRTEDDVLVVDSRDNEVLHVPPNASHLEERLDNLFRFANTTDETSFIHPVIRAILLHFMIGYEHPFVDGNGRTARALFYWAMARAGYWMTEYLSISTIIRIAPAQYARSYVFSETDDNDVTYFIDYNLRVILRAIKLLHKYLARKSREISAVQRLLAGSALRTILNHRQMALLISMRKHPDQLYTIHSHRTSHNVTYQTARTDLLKLTDLGLLQVTKHGRSFTFRPAKNIEQRLRKLG
ncbi:MAG: Fic family protein [Gammaproteobacteria bacterium]|nr:Fic family protein [Gammaproteobacteria bacterium]MYF59587.1 Fic family protein [Gammaproteobacteria bacterium]